VFKNIYVIGLMGIVGIGDVVIVLTYSIKQFIGYRAKCTLFYLEF
jgi:hypothetical protein